MQLIGIWHQIAVISGWTGLSIGMLAGLAILVYFDPRLLKLAIVAAIMVLIGYFAEIHGNAVGLVDGRAEVQAKWDEEKAAQARARAAEIERQKREAALQKEIDDKQAAELESQTKDALDQIGTAPAQDDGPVPKIILDTWSRDRALRGLK